MAESKETNLGEVYYGPSIPPAQTQRRSRRSIHPDCTPYRLVCTIFKVSTMVLIILGIITLILWLIYQPDTLKTYVDSASLTQFNLSTTTTTTTLYYNLTLDVSVRNPNKKFEIYYERLEARSLYDGSSFGYITFPSFHQPRKNTTVLHLSFQSQVPALGNSLASTYEREKGEGFYHISVKLYTRVRLKMVLIKSVRYKPEMDCELRLPVPGNATSAASGFQRTKCHVDDFS